ncbi:SdrD B-like domain-containing protein [Patescibacteria group bacterium]
MKVKLPKLSRESVLKFSSIILSTFLIFNIVSPSVAYAIDELPNVTSETDTASEPGIESDLPETQSLESEETQLIESQDTISEIWKQRDDYTYETTKTVTTGTEYILEELDNLKIVFTSLPEEAGKLFVKQVQVPEVIDGNEVVSKAYNITSDMVNGTFTYDLYIPKTKEVDNPEVKYSKDGFNYNEVEGEVVESNYVVVKALDHFTVFVITDDDASYSGGTWTDYPTQGYLDTGVHYPTSTPAGDTATWDFTAVSNGNHQVYLSWSTYTNRTTAAPFALNYNGGTYNFSVNQRLLANQATVGGVGEWSGWFYVGKFDLTNTSNLVLTTVDNTGGTDYVIADEVMLIEDPVPTIVSPANNSYFKTSGLLKIDWTDADSSDFDPYFYQYQSFSDAGYTASAYLSGWLPISEIPTPGTPEGEYYVRVRSMGSNGIMSEWSNGAGTPFKITVDNIPPTDPSSFTSNPVVGFTNDNTIWVDWPDVDAAGGASDNLSGVDGYSYSFSQGATDVPDETKDLEEDVTEVTSVPLTPDGVWYFHLRTVDNSGNWTSTAHYGPFTVDTDAPDVNISNPVASSVINGSVIIQGTVNDTNLWRYWFVVQNSGGTTVAGLGVVNDNGPTVNISYPWDTSLVPDGMYTIKLEARDKANNKDTGSVHWVTIEVDNTPPYTTLVSPLDDSYWNSPIAIMGESADTNGVDFVTLASAIYSGGNCGGYTDFTTVNNPVNDSPFNFVYNWTPPSEDSYCIKAYATDTLGNVESSAIVENVTYDVTDPTDPSNFTSNPAIGLTNDNTVWVDWPDVGALGGASDNLSGVDGYSYSFTQGSTDVPDTVKDLEEDITEITSNPLIPDGNWYFHLRTVDNAGNWTSTAHYGSFNIDTVAPATPSLVSPADGAIIQPSAAILDWTDETDLNGPVTYNYQSFWSGGGHYGPVSVGTTSQINAMGSADRVYDWQVQACDAAGNCSAWSGPWEVTIDSVAPTIDTIDDQVFDEGEMVNLGLLTGLGMWDDVGLSEVCISFGFTPFTTAMPFPCFDISSVGTGGSLPDLSGENWPIDTSFFDEGIYTFSYYVIDLAGNESTHHTVNITINNVAPVVTLDSNQTINEGDTAVFGASFTDPSYLECSFIYKLFDMCGDPDAPNDPDDAPWTVDVDYGEGAGFTTLGTMDVPGDIEAALGNIDRVYNTPGIYTVSVKVCEANGLVFNTFIKSKGEGECHTETVQVTVNNYVPMIVASPASSTVTVGDPDVTLNSTITGGNTPYQSVVWTGTGCTDNGNGTATVSTSTEGTYTYTVTVTDADGDIDTDTAIVTVNSAPEETSGTGTGVLGAFASTGSVGSINGDGVTDEQDEEEEGEILGEETCDIKSKISGYIYYDKNENGEKDEGEEGLANALVIIFREVDGEKDVITTARTDENGYWEVTACPGDYKVELDEEELPENVELLGDGVLGINVKELEDVNDINFTIKEKGGFDFNWLWCIIPLGLVGGLVIINAILKRREGNPKSF